MKKILFLFILSVLVLGVLVWFYLTRTYPQTPTQTSFFYFFEHPFKPHDKLNRHIIGFLPYWQMEAIPEINLQPLSEVNYFTLSFDAHGDLTQIVDYQTDPGWREWDTQKMKDFVTKAHIMGTKVSLTITSHDNDTIESLLDNKEAQQRLINAIISQIKTRTLDGIVIDIEYFGKPDPYYTAAFVDFSRKLNKMLERETPKATLAIAIMPREIHDGPFLFDVKKLISFYDYFIGMSYDYSGRTATSSGPTAPMNGYKEGHYFFDIATTYEEYLQIIPKKKILMGIPYYGWDRAVEDGETLASTTFPPEDKNHAADTISYAGARNADEFQPEKCQWAKLAKQTWCWYTKDGIDHQVWLEDNKSLAIKYDYAQKQDFAGIAIWVLGDDRGYTDIENILQEKFGK